MLLVAIVVIANNNRFFLLICLCQILCKMKKKKIQLPDEVGLAA